MSTIVATAPQICSLCGQGFESKKKLKQHRVFDHKEELLTARTRTVQRHLAWQKYLDPENWHPAANLMPMTSEEDFKRLVQDIKGNGLRIPVVLYKDKVIDGRNRLKACAAANIIPEFVNLEGEVDTVAWVLSTNLSRRHLTASQVVTVLLDAEDLIANLQAEAAQRMVDPMEQVPQGSKGTVRDKLGAIGGVSGRYLATGKFVKDEVSPQQWNEVRVGKKSISTLKAEITKSKKPKAARFNTALYHSFFIMRRKDGAFNIDGYNEFEITDVTYAFPFDEKSKKKEKLPSDCQWVKVLATYRLVPEVTKVAA